RERNNPRIKSPYPVEIVPLLPEFLGRRRARWTYPLRAMEELGLDRPAFFFPITLSYQPDEGARLEDLGNPYTTVFDTNLAAASAARGAGLVDETGGRWRLTTKGRELDARFRKELAAYFATLEPLPRNDLARLAPLLGEALETTDGGSRVRKEIEDETDRRFFAPWPDSVGREGAWIRAQLAAVNAALAPT